MTRKNRSSKYFFIIILILLYSILSCGDREVTDDELVELENFISDFYTLNQNLSYEDFQALFVDNSIDFYMQVDSPIGETTYSDNQKDYISMSEIITKWGKLKEYKIKKILFSPQPYDVPESDLYYIDLDVDYEGKETYESFFIKKIDTDYYVYRYWILYRSDRNTRK